MKIGLSVITPFIYIIMLGSFLIFNEIGTTVCVVALLCFFLIDICAKKGKIKIDRPVLNILLLSIFFMALQFIYVLFGYSEVHSIFLLRYVAWLLMGVAAPLVLSKLDGYKLKRLVFFSLAFLLLNLAYVVFRFRAAGVSLNTQYGKASLVVAADILLLGLHSSKKLGKLSGIAIYIVVFLVNVIVSQRVTNLLFFIAVFCALILFNQKRKSGIYIMAAFILIAAIVVYIFRLYVPIINWSSELIGSPRITRRLNTIIYFLDTGEMGQRGSMSARFDLARTSLNTFFASVKNFLVGVGDYRPTIEYIRSDLIGKHSEFIDTFARFGIFGGCTLAAISVNQYKSTFQLMRFSGNSEKNVIIRFQALVIYAVFILSNFVGNTIEAHEAFAALIILPACVRLICAPEMYRN